MGYHILIDNWTKKYIEYPLLFQIVLTSIMISSLNVALCLYFGKKRNVNTKKIYKLFVVLLTILILIITNILLLLIMNNLVY